MEIVFNLRLLGSIRSNEILRELNLSNTFGPEYKLTNKTIEAFAQCKNIQVRHLF